MKKNIFVVGLEEFNLQFLNAVRNADEYDFHCLLAPSEIVDPEVFRVPASLDRARECIRRFPDRVDGIVGYWDGPTTTLVQLLRAELGQPTPSLESLLRCEHKYWSRLVQQESVPLHTPRFAAFDPFADDPHASIDLDYPFWVKPVKAHSSYLGFRIDDREAFDRVIERIRAGISRFADPFNFVLDKAELPAEIAQVDGFHCIAEEIVQGQQCTLEGYVFEGQAEVYGTVDSLRAENRSTFTRYQYPSKVPESMLCEMAESSKRLVECIGLDHSPFNIEWLYDEEHGQAWVLEVNPRVSKSHAPLFEMVDSVSNLEIAVDLAMGRRPSLPRGEGDYPLAAKFMVREWKDALVERVPSPSEIAAIEREIPGTRIQVAVEEGTQLSDLRDQDSYSYEIAVMFIGGVDEEDILEKYQRCREALPIAFADVEPDGGHVTQ